MKLLAIDPGYGRAGFAVLTKINGADTLLFSECFETEKELPLSERMRMVGERMERHIQTHAPECVVIEGLFFAKNKKTALHIAEVRGMCFYIAQKNKLEIVEYTPNQIKSAVTGSGSAKKRDIIRMVPLLVKVERGVKRHDDEYDAIAAGITHLATRPNGMYGAYKK